MANGSKKSEIARLGGMAAGLRQHLLGQTLSLNNKPVKVEDLIAAFDAYSAAIAATAAARAVWRQRVEAERAQIAQIEAQLSALEDYLRATYGATSTLLDDFGMSPRRPRKPRASTKAVAVQKSAATRLARHTMGPKQKAAIHGVLPAVPPPPGGSGVKPT